MTGPLEQSYFKEDLETAYPLIVSCSIDDEESQDSTLDVMSYASQCTYAVRYQDPLAVKPFMSVGKVYLEKTTSFTLPIRITFTNPMLSATPTQSMINQMLLGLPLHRSGDINDLVEAVARSLESPQEENIDAWASKLANNIAQLTD